MRTSDVSAAFMAVRAIGSVGAGGEQAALSRRANRGPYGVGSAEGLADRGEGRVLIDVRSSRERSSQARQRSSREGLGARGGPFIEVAANAGWSLQLVVLGQHARWDSRQRGGSQDE